MLDSLIFVSWFPKLLANLAGSGQGLAPAFSLPPLVFAAATEAATEVATEADGEIAPLVLAGVLLSLIVVFLASKVGGEICARINLPPVLGELVGGVVVGVSALHLLVFPESGATAADSVIIQILQQTAGLQPAQAAAVFSAQSEVISVLAEIGVILLLFEIGLESDLKELIKVGPRRRSSPLSVW